MYIRLFSAGVFFVLVACGGTPGEDEVGTDDAELRAVRASELVGPIACGETKHVHHDAKSAYRALSISANKGESLDIHVHGNGLDPKAWLTTPKGTALASNDDADGTRDSHIAYTVKTTGEERIVFRDKNYEEGDFDVTLACAGGVAPPAPPAPPAPVVNDDPFDAASCDGAPMTTAEAISKIDAGNAFASLGGTHALQMRTRSCNPVTGCSAWGPTVPAKKTFYMASGGDNYNLARGFDMIFSLVVSGTSIQAAVEDVSQQSHCPKCTPNSGPSASIGSSALLGNPELYIYYPRWTHTSSGFVVEDAWESVPLGPRATGSLTVTKSCARFEALSDDSTTQYAVLFRF